MDEPSYDHQPVAQNSQSTQQFSHMTHQNSNYLAHYMQNNPNQLVDNREIVVDFGSQPGLRQSDPRAHEPYPDYQSAPHQVLTSHQTYSTHAAMNTEVRLKPPQLPSLPEENFDPNLTSRESTGAYTSRSSAQNQMAPLPVKFQLNWIILENKFVPLAMVTGVGMLSFFLYEMVVAVDRTNIIQTKPIDIDTFLFWGLLALPILTFGTIVFYLLVSFTNPGFIIGNEEIQLKKAVDYDIKHNHQKKLSINESPVQDQQVHQRQKSMLHKDQNLVSRHDRNRSQMGSTVQYSYPMTQGNHQQYELANLESQPSFYQNQPMERTTVKNFMASGTQGQYDNQMSLQLYGQAPTTQGSGGPTMGGSTLPSTVQTQQTLQSRTRKGKKGGKKIHSKIKGIQGINSKQLVPKKEAKEEDGEGERKEGALESIQKRIQEVKRQESLQNKFNSHHFGELVDEEDEEEGGKQQLVDIDHLVLEEDEEGEPTLDPQQDFQHRPSDGLNLLQQHLNAKMNKMSPSKLNMGGLQQQQVINDEAETPQLGAHIKPEVDEEDIHMDASARIEHAGATGTLDIPNLVENDEILEEGKGTNRFNRKRTVQTEEDIVIEGMEDLDQPTRKTDEDEEEDENAVPFIQNKYCTVCHIEQPLRTKHCKTCDQCIATHDHHCPWTGNCVGERNKVWFYIYIVLQQIHLSVTLYLCIHILMAEHGRLNAYLPDKYQLLVMFILLVAIAFFIFVLPLTLGHTYLISINMTSWEFLSRSRITYMQVWPKKYGSPFNQGGVRANLQMFFCYNFRKPKQSYQWRIPTKFPTLQK